MGLLERASGASIWRGYDYFEEKKVLSTEELDLVITFNHKDGAETIPLKDVETALAEAGFGSDLVSLAVPIKDGVNDRLRLLFMHWNRGSKDLIAICRWHIATTSSKTGCCLNFCPPHGGAVPSGICRLQRQQSLCQPVLADSSLCTKETLRTAKVLVISCFSVKSCKNSGTEKTVDFL